MVTNISEGSDFSSDSVIKVGFSPTFIIILTQCYYYSRNPFKCHEEVLYLQPMIPPKRFDISPPDWGMLRRSRRVLIFL